MSVKKKKMKTSAGYRVFTVCNTLFMLCMIFIMAYPVYYVIIVSISDAQALTSHTGALLKPLEPLTTLAYQKLLEVPQLLTGYRNTIFIVVVGVGFNLVLTSLTAFFLTIKGPMLKGVFMTMIIIAMYTSGGLIPTYLNIKSLGLLNTYSALILPVGLSTSNMIILRCGFQAVPESLVESARLDGASYLRILTRIMLPLSKASLAVIVLYYGVSHWNSWFNAMIYLKDEWKYPLQLVMRNLLGSTQSLASSEGMDMTVLSAKTMRCALIVVGSAPIVMLYPFMQKYFVKGVMVGSIKG